MTAEEFNNILAIQLGYIQKVLEAKTEEYANEDQLHNFVMAAELKDETVKEAVAGMMVKHTVSIYDMVRSPEVFNPHIWDEKITDHIIYLILLRAAVIEETRMHHLKNS